MNFTAAKCPICGADIQVDEERTNCFCSYCGSQIQVQSAINNASIDGIASEKAIMTRAYQFLQISDFEKAGEYFSKALDLNPTNGNAFLGQLLSTLKCTDSSKAEVYVKDYTQFKFAEQYGDEAVRAELKSLVDSAKERFEREMNAIVEKGNSISLSCNAIYHFLWDDDERPCCDDFEQLKKEMCCSERFDKMIYPAVAFYDSECSTTVEVLPALETALSNKNHKVILFVRNCDDELLQTLNVNCLRGVFKCALVCVEDPVMLRKMADFCGNVCNSAEVTNLECAYVDGNRIALGNKIVLENII